ncbi:DUF1631 family protein [Arenimonas sp. GDDSR-1]|uniref:DUF1631 family protein n=1 Tax=Arenimonas sp. GDDSR-1 TaxID=2950125 RepID=UPI002603870C|nr:DUF1631 family protein [Arenimonas sp. GDDSR-1]
MDSSGSRHVSGGLHQAGLPVRVLALCDGLLDLGSDFFERQLHIALNEFEDLLFKSAEHVRGEQQSEHFGSLRNLKRTRHDFIPQFLSSLEQQLAGIRQPAGRMPRADAAVEISAELRLLDVDDFDLDQIQTNMAGRCESQNSFELFLLAQRLGVLAAGPAFSYEQVPFGPKRLCDSFRSALACLGLDPDGTRQIYHLFERHVLGHYAELLQACNAFLAGKGVLPNLTYVPFRNPLLRHKRAATAKAEEAVAGAATEPASAKIYTLFPNADAPKKSAGHIEESFSKLQHLLARRKQLLNKLNSFSNTYLSGNAAGDGAESPSVAASDEQIGGILDEFQRNAVSNPGVGASIQHLKHDLIARLRNQSTPDKELTLDPEDSDAIDLVGLLMDDAMKSINPGSPTAQLIAMMQTPLIRVVMRDKSFFSDRVHPARQMLNILAEAGFNWLESGDADDGLQGSLAGIVGSTVRDFDGDSRQLLAAYEETNRLLQSLIKKAEAAERRQIDVSKAKEKLRIARDRAEKTMSGLMAEQDIPVYTKAMLNEAWADVMALTELRNGAESDDWRDQKKIAENIIAANTPANDGLSNALIEQLKLQIQQSLSLVGYHEEEAAKIAVNLIERNAEAPEPVPHEKPRLGESTRSVSTDIYDLDDEQKALVDQLKDIPIGTWFEFLEPGANRPSRAKLTWLSRITHNVLFVNQRGHKTAEMLLEELAVEISEGRVWIQQENKQGIFERAFENMITSLRNFLPGGQDKNDD